MAGDKKRRASRSPTRIAVAKKVREPSNAAFAQYNNRAPSREHSFFRGESDPYFPGRYTRSALALPSNDDWVFRVKVISSTMDLQDAVFRNAVQGLVKICFPQDVLEELGVEIVKQHMREENAPNGNISRMSEIFRGEMMHRMTWMLAEYLDTPEKLKTGVRSIIAASENMHDEIGANIVHQVVSSLSLPSGYDENVEPSEVADITPTGPVAPPIKAKKKAKADKTKETLHVDAINYDGNMNTEVPLGGSDSLQAPTETTIHENKKVSGSWRWNIDPDDILPEAKADAFQRPSDLFAFHALSIAKSLLDATANRRVIRRKIQAMLDEMPDTEYMKWVESFQKLHSGDDTMLIRVELEATAQNLRTAATPAPVDRRRSIRQSGGPIGATLDHSALRIKSERDARLDATEKPKHGTASQNEEELTVTTPALRHLSFGEHGSESTMIGSPLQPGHEAAQAIQPASRLILTPIIDLMWGRESLSAVNRMEVIDKIMMSLNRRVMGTSTGIQLFNGTTIVMTKATLKLKLKAMKTHVGAIPVDIKVRMRMEKRLVPWVVANLPCFPELLSQPFVFCNMVPFASSFLDALCDPMMSMAKKNTADVKAHLYGALEKRGIDVSVRSGPRGVSLDVQICTILADPKHNDVAKRGLLEEVLRHVAFEHREKFLDQKTSLVVRTWERETGEKW